MSMKIDDKILIVRGVKDFDELKRFGLAMARKVADADVIVAVDGDRCKILKSRERCEAEFIDGESRISELAEIMEKLKRSYVESRPPVDAHLGHAIVGMWLFYWMDPQDSTTTPIQMAAVGDLAGLRASAQRFIESDFGLNVGAASKIPDDGGSDTETARVSRPVSERPQASGDSR